MPLLRNHKQDDVQETSPTRKGSIFSSRSHEQQPVERSGTNKSNGFFSLNRRNSSSDLSDHSNGGGSFFAFNHSKGDPALAAGRQKVADAEAAERAADKALSLARSSVREAKLHVKQLEEDALEE